MSTNERILKRIMAFVLAILLFVNALPGQMLMQVSATVIDSYTILLDGMEEENKEGISVTLTNKDNEEQTKIVETDEDGKAVFEDGFVDDACSYQVKVIGRIGYADYEGELQKEDVEKNTEYGIDLSSQPQLEKVTLQGKIVDREGNPISEAKIEYSAYNGRLTNKAEEENTPDGVIGDVETNKELEVTTNENGEYSFEVYQDIEYIIDVQKEGYTILDNETIKVTATDGENGNIVEAEDGKKSVAVEDIKLAIKTYEITTEIANLNSGNPQGSIRFKEGSSETVNYKGEATVIINANENYEIKEIKVNEVVVSEGITKDDNKQWQYTIEDVQEDCKITAVFERTLYPIEFTCGSNGEITYDANGEIESGKTIITNESGTVTVNVKKGENAIFVVKPIEGYQVREVLIDNNRIDVSNNIAEDGTYSGKIENINEEHKVSVSFSIKNYSVELTTNFDNWDDGRVWGTIGFAEGSSGDVEWDGSSTVNVKANTGYKIKQIKIGNEVVSIDNIKEWSYTFTEIKENKTVTAEFEKVFFDITVEVTDNGKVTYGNQEEGVTNQKIQEGEKPEFSVKANKGYHIEKLILQYEGIEETKIVNEENIANEGNTQNEYTISFEEGVYKNYTIQAEFAINTYQIQTKVKTTGWDDGRVWGTIGFAKGSSGTVDWNGSSTVNVKANTGYKIKQIEIGDEVVSIGSIKEWSYTFTEIQENKTIRAEFEKLLFPISFEYENGKVKHGGNLISTNGRVNIQEGEKPGFTVTANEGYHIEQIEIIPTTEKVRNVGITIKPDSEAENWSVLEEGSEGVISGTYTFRNGVFESFKVKVTFTINTYKVDTEIKESQDGGSITCEEEVNHGGEVDFTIEPKPGFRIGKIMVEETDVYGNTKTITDNTLESIAAELIDEVIKKDNEITGYGNIIYRYTGEKAEDTTLEETESEKKYVGVKGNVKITVTFEEVETSNRAWQDDIEFTSDNMSIQQKGNILYVYSQEKTVEITPKQQEGQGLEETENSQETTEKRINVSTPSANQTSWLGWKENHSVNVSGKIPTYDIQEIQITADKIWNREKVNLEGAVKIAFDKTSPQIETNALVVENTKNKINDVFWITDDTTTITSKATDANISEDVAGSGISHIVWSIGKKLDVEAVLAVGNNAEADSTNNVGTVEIKEDGTYSIDVKLEDINEIVYYVYAVDKVNNISAPQIVNIKKDISDPQIKEIHFKKQEKAKKDIKFEEYGIFSPEPIVVTVTVEDGVSSAGLEKIDLYSDDKIVFTAFEKDIKRNDANEEVTYTTEFTLEGKNFNGNVIYAKAVDNVQRESEKKNPMDEGIATNAKSEKVTISNEEPKVNIIEVPKAVYTKKTENKPDEMWYASPIEFGVNAKTDNVNLGIKSLTVTEDKVITEPEQNNPFTQVESSVTRKGITASKEGKNVITATAISNAGIDNDDTVTVYIDTNAPDITKFEFEKIDESKILQFLTFGTFGNGKVKITVTADDSKDDNGKKLSAYSGVKKITLYRDEKILETKSAISLKDENGTVIKDKDGNVIMQAVFIIPTKKLQNNKKQFDKVISAIVTDNVGNTTQVMPNEENSNIKNSGLMIETKKPSISLTTDGIVYTEKSKDEKTGELKEYKWCNQDINYYLTVEDEDSGIGSVVVKINRNTVINKDFSEKETKITKKEFTISTSQAEIKEDGSYTIKVEVIDNAGNKQTRMTVIDNTGRKTKNVKTEKVYKDETAPSIEGFTFKAKGYQEPNSEKLVARKTDYGYYFEEDAEITITAKDIVPTSGIEKITYYTVDYEDEKNPVISKEKTRKVDANNEIKIDVKKDFKGQIFAKATDNVGNEPKNGEKKEFVSPEGVIVEHPELHEKTSSIKYTLPKTDYKDEEGNNLYDTDTEVKVEIVDTYSGIRKVDWRIIAAHDDKQQAGVVTVDNNGEVISEALEGYRTDCLGTWKATTERNLVTKLTNTILVSNNCNNIVIEFSLEDRAGNKTQKVRQKLSIDKTSSTIQVTMNNNDDEEFEGLFKEDRNAEITIHERNFENENVVFNVIRTDDNEVQIQENIAPQFAVTTENGKAKSFVDENGIEYYEYKMNYVFSQEGDYAFQISSKDKVSRENTEVTYSDPVIDQAFTVDKTAPIIQVSYDNNAASEIDGRYFNEARTATISITEHNFEEARITYTRTSTREGSVIEEPAVSSWSQSGNVYTATITYETEGDYTFDVTMNDKAGNVAEGVDYGNSVSANEFTIDTTIEKPVITGVENGKAYRDDVVLGISFEDINFETDEIVLLRTTKGKINEDITDEFIEAYMQANAGGTGRNGTMDIFDKVKENDGIYTLKVKVADKAANEETDERVFTLNRFGSVYAFGEYMTTLQETYVQKVEDSLVITEYNPSPLVDGSENIQITCDGAPLENIQSSLKQVKNKNVKAGESGWYQYEYVIDASNFEKDGLYKLFVSSEDESGNKPEITNELGYDVMFHVDNTQPEITNITGLENIAKSPDEDLSVNYEIFDAIGLKNVKVFIDGDMKENITKFENLMSYSDGFNLNGKGKHKIQLVVEDLAGNITNTDSDFNPGYAFYSEVTVTDSLIVRMFLEWYEKQWFWGSIVGAAAAIIAPTTVAVIMHRRRKLKKK